MFDEYVINNKLSMKADYITYSQFMETILYVRVRPKYYFDLTKKLFLVLYKVLNLVVGPLSVYVCALNRTFLLVGWWACLVRTKNSKDK